MLPIPENVDQRIFQALYAAQQVAQRLSSLVTALSPKYAHVNFYTRTRVKTFDSIKAKITRKRNFEKKPYYNFSSLTDVVGLRIVTLYDEDLPEAVHLVADILRAGQTFVQPLTYGESIWPSIKEAKFFVRPGSSDSRPDVYRRCRQRCIDLMTEELAVPQVVDHFARRMQIVTEDRENDYTYSSAHFVVNARYYSENVAYPVYVEIQLRTALEDVWAEVNHALLYKAKEYYVWAPEIDKAYDDLKIDSDRVKERVEEVAKEISKFKHDHVSDYLKKIKEFRNPSAAFHSSLGVTLLQAIGQRVLNNMGPIFNDYEEALSEFTENHSVDALKDCFAKFIRLKRHLKEQEKRTLDQAESDLLNQHLKIAEFEVMRLRTLFLTEFRLIKKGTEFEFLPEATDSNGLDAEFNSEALAIYERFCKIRNDPALQLRPISAILFWKYYVLRKVDSNSAYLYLKLAYDELSFDTSLPEWSIYYVLIPRCLATEMQNDMSSLIATNSTAYSRAVGPAIRVQIRTWVILAARYAMQACERTFSPHKRRGDIIFGFEDDHFIKDGDIIVSILLDYFQTYGGSGRVRDTIFEEIEITGKFLQNLPKRGRAAAAAAGRSYPAERGRQFERKLRELMHFYRQNEGLPR
jgi:ppGpp synthetase/RelA/SpoT-type nucleotidyltranferase